MYGGFCTFESTKSKTDMRAHQFVFLGVAGHGGMVDGKYTTAPSKMVTFPDKKVIYEGVENRAMIEAIQTVNALGYSHGVNFINLVPENQDIPLATRELRIKQARDKYAAWGMQVILFESHLNADDGSGKAFGAEGFTTVGHDFSDVFGEAVLKRVQDSKLIRLRTDSRDGDLDKEVDFYLIRKAKKLGVPAFLMEWFFMTNRSEVDKFANQAHYLKCAHLVLDAMREIDQKYKGVIPQELKVG
jgi:N-acetylmuramoyl-L-alanine amidase